MSLIDRERRPVSFNGGNGQSAFGTTRRRAGANQQQYATETTPIMSASTFSPPPPLPPESTTKDHGKKFFGRMMTAVSPFFERRNTTTPTPYITESELSRDEPPKEYYRDNFNEHNRTCSFGTNENDGIWMNRNDPPGTILSFTVWILIIYSALTVTLLAQSQHLEPLLAMMYYTLAIMSLACHAKTMFTDPGSVPESAVPIESISSTITCHVMCSQCQTFKPQFSHHCRICNRCISRMDHHCPWMNNCIGSGNLKHFILFLIYTWSSCTLSLLIFGWNYFLCSNEDCTFTPVLIQLVRVMTIFCIATLLFSSSMIMNVTYGLMTGIGTIDRLKKKANNTLWESDEEPILLKDVFGVAGYHTWLFPVDPLFEDFDRVMGYSTPQRLLREQSQENPNEARSGKCVGKKEYAPV